VNRLLLETNLRSLLYQRNIFAGLAVLLATSVVGLTALLFNKTERVIVCPPTIEKEFWIDSHTVSNTYLEQFGVFLGQLLLGKSSQSASAQRSVILRHTDPVFSTLVRKKLIEEEDMLTRQSASYVFFPVEIKVDQAALKVQLTGDRALFVGGKQVSLQRKSYALCFSYQGSRLLLKDIVETSIQ